MNAFASFIYLYIKLLSGILVRMITIILKNDNHFVDYNV